MTQPPEPIASLSAETAVLGAVLVNNDLIQRAEAIVKAEDFFRDAHQKIWRSFLRLRKDGKAIDLVSAAALLRSKGLLEDVGGAGYISRLTDGVPRSTNIETYAQIIRDCADRRRLAGVVAEAGRALDGGAELQDVVSKIRLHLDLTAGAAQGSTPAAALRLADEIDRERARREAKRQLDLENLGRTPFPEILTLRERLARPLPPVKWRIANWQPAGSRVVMAAQFKAGKTTLVGGLVRSLVDVDPFLGRDAVEPIDGRVVVLDLEMSGHQLDDYLRSQGIRHDDRVVVIPLRGSAAAFNVLDPACRSEWAVRLRAVACGYLVLDCLRPILDALGLDEKADAGRLLVAFDGLLAEAGIPEACVVHHMGHAHERSRGDSRIRDWPDVEWRLVRQDDDPASPRYISAYGRDVAQPEALLAWDQTTRHLTIAGGSRRDAKADAALDAVLDVIAGAAEPLSGREIKRRLVDGEHTRDAIDAALKLGISLQALDVTDGPHKAKLYSQRASVRVSGSVRIQSPDSVSECPGAYIAPDTGHSPDEIQPRVYGPDSEETDGII